MTIDFQEKKLLFQIRTKKDPDAYALLYDKYVKEIYRFVFFKVSDKEVAQDVTSDVFLYMWKHLTTTEASIQSFRGLLYRISRNKIIDVYRAKFRSKTVSIDSIKELASEDDITSILDLEQSVSHLLNVAKGLKQDYQEIILFRYVEDMSIKEISEVMGKKQTAVRVTLHRALKKLQLLINESS